MSKRASILIQIIFWILYFILVSRLLEVNNRGSFTSLWQSSFLVFTFAGISYFNALVLIPKLFAQKRYLVYAFAILALMVLSPFAYLGLIKLIRSLFAPDEPHFQAMLNPLRQRYMRLLLTTCLFLFASTTIRLIIDFSRKEKQRIQLEKERLLAETRFLRSQMNPHFFLNALNNLNAIIRLSPNKSEKYINTLADMMRYVTYDCKNKHVPIRGEINYIRNYIYAQQIKDDEIRVNLDTRIENDETPLEPMLLMPFVENAFKHGVAADEEHNAIFIRIHQEQEKIYFACRNKTNTQAKANADPAYSGVGIKNVKERLAAAYPKRHKLHIDNKNTFFEVELELHTGPNKMK